MSISFPDFRAATKETVEEADEHVVTVQQGGKPRKQACDAAA
ncbi:hypothetical protein [Candidatus Electrothrix sp.]